MGLHQILNSQHGPAQIENSWNGPAQIGNFWNGLAQFKNSRLAHFGNSFFWPAYFRNSRFGLAHFRNFRFSVGQFKTLMRKCLFGTFPTPMRQFLASVPSLLTWHVYSAKKISLRRSFLREIGAQTFYTCSTNKNPSKHKLSGHMCYCISWNLHAPIV